MKYGANTFIWISPFRTEAFHIVDIVADLGFDVIETAFEDPSLVDVKKLAQLVKQRGIAVATCGAFGPDRDLISDDPAVQDNAKTYIKQCLDFAGELESPIFCGPAYSAVGKTRLVDQEQKKVEWQRAIDNLGEMGEYAQKRGVTIALETLNRFETDFLNIASDLKRLIQDINHPQVKGHLDTFHMNIEEKHLGDAIRLMGNDLVHFHTCENDRGTPGTGHIDWIEVKEALQDIGYDDFAVIESFTPGNKEIAKAAAIWRPLEKDEDTLASKGLAFLKQLFAD